MWRSDVDEQSRNPGVPLLQVLGLRRAGFSASFQLGRGECIALQGPSGSGKTLLLRSLADLDACEGEVWLDGVEREQMPGPIWRRKVCYVAAESAWWADRVEDHFRHWPTAADRAGQLGLSSDCGKWTVARLSTGERQRLALVRALEIGPSVLLLDEPTSGLDPDSVEIVERSIAEERSRGLAVIWVTHDAAQVRRVALRLLVIRGDVIGEMNG
jgi:putative ABC transport system ATP-binding protein